MKNFDSITCYHKTDVAEDHSLERL